MNAELYFLPLTRQEKSDSRVGCLKSRMKKRFTPSGGPGDWQALLADQETQWARGFSDIWV